MVPFILAPLSPCQGENDEPSQNDGHRRSGAYGLLGGLPHLWPRYLASHDAGAAARQGLRPSERAAAAHHPQLACRHWSPDHGGMCHGPHRQKRHGPTRGLLLLPRDVGDGRRPHSERGDAEVHRLTDGASGRRKGPPPGGPLSCLNLTDALHQRLMFNIEQFLFWCNAVCYKQIFKRFALKCFYFN